MNNSHPNEFIRRKIQKFFEGRFVDVNITSVSDGYVVFFNHISVFDACEVADPAAKIVYDSARDEWELHWISGDFRWHLYNAYPKMHEALETMFGDKAANLFHKVI